MNHSLIAKAQVKINAPIARVWDALVNPDLIRQYMAGTNAVSDWKEGAPIVWRGVWEGKPYNEPLNIHVQKKVEPPNLEDKDLTF